MARLTADWCRSIATMFASGLTPQQIFSTIQQQISSNDPLFHVCNQAIPLVESGISFVEILYDYDCVSAYHYQLLKVAEYSGQLSKVLIQIAYQIERSQARNQRLKIQLRVSQAIISIGLLAHIVLSLFQKILPIAEVLFFIILMLVTNAIYRLLMADLFSVLAWIWHNSLAKLMPILARFFEYYVYQLLLLQLAAGIDPQQALAQLQELFPSPQLKQKLRLAQGQIIKGASLTTTLVKQQLIITTHLKQVMQIGEASGRLTDNLEHHLQQEEKKLALVIDSIYEWLPRFYYVLALVALINYVF